jgi:hypothetical protein
VQRPLTSGPREWLAGQTPWPVGPILQPLMGSLHGDTLQEAVEGNPKLKVGEGELHGQSAMWQASRPPLGMLPT